MNGMRVMGVICLLGAVAAVPARPPELSLTRVAGGLRNVNHAVFHPADDGRLYVVEQRDRYEGDLGTGRVRVVDTTRGEVRPEPVLELSGFSTNGNPLGITGFCFDPDFADNGFVYVCATGENGSDGSDGLLATVVARYELEGDRIDATTRRPVLTLPQRHLNHNGNFIGFGPDGLLYVSVGDDSPFDLVDVDRNAQDLSTRSGALLRVDVHGRDGAFHVDDAHQRFAIPAGNPFVGVEGADPALFAVGLRNPYRLAWDRATGDLWVSDTGQHHFEEVDVLPAGTSGQNFDYPFREGREACPTGPAPTAGAPSPAAFVEPVHAYPHPPELPNHRLLPGAEMGAFEGVAVIGGVVYRGALASLRGRYLFGDMDWRGHGGRLWSFRPEDGVAADLADHTDVLGGPGPAGVDLLSAFVEDPRGEVLLLDYEGEVFALGEGGSSPLAVAPWALGLLGLVFVAAPRRRRGGDGGAEV